jgi:hypothetical protein
MKNVTVEPITSTSKSVGWEAFDTVTLLDLGKPLILLKTFIAYGPTRIRLYNFI